MFCTDITELLRRVYPTSLDALVEAVGRSRTLQNFLTGLIEVSFYFDSVGGSVDALNRILRFGFRVGQVTRGSASQRIPYEVINVIDDLEHLWGKISPRQYRELIEDMGSQYTKFRGGMGVLRFLRQRGYQNIAALEVTSSTTRRVFDVVLNTGGRFAIEVKNWTEFSSATRRQWASAGRQLARDLMGSRRGGSDVIWIFFTTLETSTRTRVRSGSATRTEIVNKLVDGIGQSLFRNHRRRISIGQLINRLSRIDNRNLRRNGSEVLRGLLEGPEGIVVNRDLLIAAIRDFHRNAGHQIFIDPS